MARAEFVKDKENVVSTLRRIAGKTVRIHKGPVSYYLLRKFREKGLLKMAPTGRKGKNGKRLVGFELSARGKNYLYRHTGSHTGHPSN